MATSQIVAAMTELAHRDALEVVREHGPAERVERLDNLGNPNPRQPDHLAAYQAELVASLAEIVEGQGRRIAELEKAARPEKPTAAAAKGSAEGKASPGKKE